ncbi:MAG TPA: hypothetical protein VMX54_04840 [Vicinamibacteria bacterium]|nr:hypothetical protein [Vicinamibacteria bacterium]
MARAEAATWRAVAADFGRLVGLAVALSLAVGLLLTAAAVALPAPLQPPAVDPSGTGSPRPASSIGTPPLSSPTPATPA